MRNRIIAFAFIILAAACSRNAITGRKQMAFFNEADIQSMASDQYKQFLTTNKVIATTTSKDAEMVRRVGSKIATAITKYYTDQGLGKELEGYKWEYNLVDSKEVNAWCMPGGKIVVYSGLLPITQNEAALAAVMGHEIAHALAKHGNERMSQATVQQAGGIAVQVAVANKTPEAQNLFLNAFGVGSTLLGTLPFSRKHELEADRLGLMYAAMAGYNPQEAIALWERMEKASAGQKPPEFLSTHPSEGTRIEQLKKYMPEALKYYNSANSSKK
ncbi:MAG: M48 family metallopeptidase [Chitinophagaceae bacterium]|jgi:predicted Zn-dependent protease|uniref:M48 family metallopeptidase n=1 Tax=unclassified Paraflavitalea TaxID=2798305 RepID=UPI003D3461E3|nr:M48 family metallopeptidase [Chitinophagaceae bacterium]